jgi:glycosyltransferase involved in cell wall biosynthesis
MRASVVIPAYNESRTIHAVLEPIVGHPLVEELLVISDGSTDDTAARARFAGARVIELAKNHGKATAMAVGAETAVSDFLLFVDADLTGLTPQMVTRMLTPVMSGDCEMFVGICDRRVYWMNRLLHYTPIISGERALRRDVWERVPPTYLKNFQIEIALNFFAKRSGARMAHRVIPGLKHVIKERKRGFWHGIGQRLLMICDILIVAWRLYVVYETRALLQPEARGVAKSAAPPPAP